jgi:pimeloyl-ACP methyl ester carboxylesterase
VQHKIDFSTTPGILRPAVLDRPDCTLRYWTAGSGNGIDVVLSHGATADHRMFNVQVPSLVDAGYRVVVYDARGHGASRPMTRTPSIDDYVADLLALTDQLRLDRPVLVGQSLGAYVAQHALIRRPEDFRALVVIGGILISDPVSRADLLLLRSAPALVWLLPWPRFVRMSARAAAVTPEAQAYMLDCLRTLDRNQFARIWHGVSTAVRVEGFPSLPDIPTLWTYGDHDDRGKITSDARALAGRHLPHLTIAVIADAGHNANQDNPATFDELLLSFLTTLAV